MTYCDFKSAAMRHKETCTLLMSLITSISEENVVTRTLNNIYYLSGYIIECMMKYCIFDTIGYDSLADVTRLNQDGLSFHKDILTHNKEHLLEVLKSKSTGFSLSVYDNPDQHDPDAVNMIRQWHPKYRYESIAWPLEKVTTCLTLSVNTEIEMLKIVKG